MIFDENLNKALDDPIFVKAEKSLLVCFVELMDELCELASVDIFFASADILN